MLIEAATTLFIEKGYQQTTFADVAERSGISRGSIPWHFGNKEGLLSAVLDHASETVFDPSDATRPPQRDDLTMQAKRLSMVRTSLLFVALYVEAVKPASPIHDKYVALHDRLRDSAKRWVAAFVRLPDTVSADDLAVILVGAVIGIHLQAAMAPEKVRIDYAVDKLSELLEVLGR